MGIVSLAGSLVMSIVFVFWVFAASGYPRLFSFFASLVMGPILWGCAMGLYLSIHDPCMHERAVNCDG